MLTSDAKSLPQFQCPICIYSYGHAEGRVWKGVDIFMEHVSSHRGKDISYEGNKTLNLTGMTLSY